MWTVLAIIQFIIFCLPNCCLKHKDIQNYNVASGLIWSSNTKGTEPAADVQELCTEEDIWAQGIEVIDGWEELHNEDLHELQSSPNIIWVIKSRRMRWTGHV
jgi:hypothetical protein